MIGTGIALYAFGALCVLALYLFGPTEESRKTNAQIWEHFRGKRAWMCLLIFLACLLWPLVIAWCWAQDLNKLEWYE